MLTHQTAARRQRNYGRAGRVSYCARENFRLGKAILAAPVEVERAFWLPSIETPIETKVCEPVTMTVKQMIQAPDVEREFKHHRLEKLVRSLRECAKHSVVRMSNGVDRNTHGGKEYIGSIVCRHRLCAVCNSERKRALRRRYYNYLKQNENLRNEYRFLHLTLTVPHEGGTFRGKRVYLSELLQAFREMRNCPGWKSRVWAGEYSVEFTRGSNGLHCHLHAVVLVRDGKQARNDFHEYVLRTWNACTVDESLPNEWAPGRLDGIARSVAYMGTAAYHPLGKTDPKAAMRFAKRLDPRGATLIGAETLYYVRNGKKTHIGKGAKVERFLKGIMEALKYHFEPLALKKEGGAYDTDLVLDLVEDLYRRRLHSGFGKWYNGGPSKKDELDPISQAAENAQGVPVDFETGKELDPSEYQFVDVSARRMDVNHELTRLYLQDHKPIPADTVTGAFQCVAPFWKPSRDGTVEKPSAGKTAFGLNG